MQMPRRSSLVTQLVSILRQQIAEGRWRDVLPGEHPLCHELGVSRPTLRAALEVLERDGLIRTAQGHRRQIAKLNRRTRWRAAGHDVGMVWPEMLCRNSPFKMLCIDEIREQLQMAGYRLVAHSDHRIYRDRPEKWLESIVQVSPAKCWLLYMAPARVQQWFADRGIAAVISGSRHPGVRLPAHDVHHRAASRHAVGVLARQGHRRIALITPESHAAGDLLTEEGFNEGFKTSRLNPNDAVVHRHRQQSFDGLGPAVETMVRERRVTALITTTPPEATHLISHLMNAGYRLPEDLSLVCRDDDVYLQYLVPSVARYTFNRMTYARRLSRLVVRLAQEGHIPARQSMTIPSLNKADTIGSVPAGLRRAPRGS